MKNDRLIAAAICAFGVLCAAMFLNMPTGVAGSTQAPNDDWEVVTTHGGDCNCDSLRARVDRLEEIVAEWESGARESKPQPQPEPWQEAEVVQVGTAQQPNLQTTVVCTGGTCRQQQQPQPQQARNTGPLRRIFRR